MTSLSKPVFSNSKLGLALIAATMVSMATLYAPLANAAPIYKVIDEKQVKSPLPIARKIMSSRQVKNQPNGCHDERKSRQLK